MRVIPTIGVLLVAAFGAVVIAACKFGVPFLRQFFISPFQFFILVPCGFAAYSLKTGIVPLKSGGRFLRDVHPREFWQSVKFCVVMGAAAFAFNFWISWQVLSRHR